MKRKYAVSFALSLSLLLTLVVIPSGLARRAAEAARTEVKKPSEATAKSAAPAPSAARNLAVRQADSLVPVSARAVGFAVSPAVRDMPPEEGLKLDPEADADKVVKSNPNKIIRSVDPSVTPDANDPVTQSSASTLAAPATSVSFDGIDSQANIPVFGGLVMPPDTVGDVGPNHYVQMVNSNYRVFDKSGAALTPVRSLGSLWATISGPCANTNDGDPVVLYDSLADRWMLSQFCVSVANPNNHQLIAVSATGDPTGAYYLYDFMMPNNKFNDYPHFGVWPDGYYMTDNQFNQAGTAFQGAGVFAFDRAKMLAGDPTAAYVYFDMAGNPSTADAGGVLPADADGLIPPPPGAACPFAYFTANEFGDPQGDAIRLFDFHADFANPAASTFAERADSPVAVAAFDPSNPAGRQDIEQQGTTSGLDSIQDRLLHRLQYRRFADGRESLIANHTVNAGTGSTVATHQAAVRYYELRRNGGGYAVAEQATFAPDAVNRWMGSAAMDNAGNLAVGYSASASSLFPSVRYAGRLATDPPNGLHQGEGTLHAGTGSQTSTSGRWGDYSSLNVDPSDDCTFWYTQEYYAAPSSAAGWRTRVGSFRFEQCAAPASGAIQVNVTYCDNPSLPVSGAVVALDGNVYGATGAAGQNLSQVTPGAHGVVVTAPGFGAATATTSVAAGGVSVVNVCLTGVPSVKAAGSTLTAESCTPADNSPSPGETVTLDFGMKNDGTASTSNLVATLRGTGGVTAPSGPQSYGVLAPGGPASARPFTFTVDASVACGGAVTATFDLQDGAAALGSVTYVLQVGSLGPPATATRGSGNLNTPIPDLGSVDIPINVPDTGAVGDVNVRVRLNHTFAGDLRVALVHPDGTQVPLSNQRGGSGDNYGTGANDCSGVFTVFDDQAAAAIASGTAPFAGSFRPDSPLSALNGKASAGVWKLRVSDEASLDVGSVGCVQLEIKRNRYVCCGVAGTPQIEAAPPATLEAESCAAPNLAVDPEETITVNFPVRNVGDGATTNLVATLQNSGGVVPVTASQSYGVVGPLDAAPTSRPFEFVARGNCGQMITATLQLQDGAVNLGAVTYNFRLGTTATGTHTFANAAPITIPSSGAGAPSPSSVNVSAVGGTVTRVGVRLNGLSHTFPDDVDVLLVGPGGQKFIVMSDAGGSADAVNAVVTLDDTAANAVPDSSVISTNAFRFTNYGTGDTFATPAPYLSPAPAGAATSASVFGGQNPNGVWSLYVTDDLGGDFGQIARGWELIITTEDPVCCDSACTITVPADVVVPNDAGECGATVNYAAAAVGGSCGVLSYSHASGSTFPVGVTAVTVTATRADNTTTTRTFNVTVVDAEAPTVTAPANVNVNSDAGSCSAIVNPGAATADDNCGAGVAGARGDGQPLNAPYPVGTTTITWTATDAAGNSASATQTVTVSDAQNPSAGPIAIGTSSLRPPNHDLINVGLAGGAFGDNCPGATRQVLVFSDEDDDAPTGDGNHSPDAGNIGLGSLRLRSERNGGGDGRVYLVVNRVTDAAGNVSASCATVTVPHGNSPASKASADAQAAAAAAFCSANAGAPPAGYFVVGDGPVLGPKQ